MPKGEPDFNLLGQLTALSQVGLEMAAAVGIGVALDYYFGWAPWASICGAILGLVGGIAHLVAILNQRVKNARDKPPRDGT
jgi:F0F1-type ATP synthase assembly protein I